MFRKGGRLRKYEKMYSDKSQMEIVSSYKNLDAQVSCSGSWYVRHTQMSLQTKKVFTVIVNLVAYFVM